MLMCVYEPLCEPVGYPYYYDGKDRFGPFCRWESKVEIWFADGFVLWQSEGDTYGDMNNAEAINY